MSDLLSAADLRRAGLACHLAQASNIATRAQQDDAALDFDALHADWA